jgi:TRAP-type C4-dicarboxylate transport system permease large subunit
LLAWVNGFQLSPLWILFVMFWVLILLGMFMDGVSMMLIAVPIFFPLAIHLGFDPIWYGLFMLLTIDMGGLTPPFGLLLYVMLGIAPKGTTLFDVASAAMPFLLCDVVLIVLLVLFPAIALFLPGFM